MRVANPNPLNHMGGCVVQVDSSPTVDRSLWIDPPTDGWWLPWVPSIGDELWFGNEDEGCSPVTVKHRWFSYDGSIGVYVE